MQKYLAHWYVDAPVFTRPVEPGDLFFSERVKPQLARLEMICGQSQALILVTGEAGSGKTSILKWLAAQLPTETTDVLLTTMVRREMGAGWLAPRLAAYFGVKADNAGSLLRAVTEKLDELLQERRKLVMMIDAAHFAATPEAFDELVALANLQALAGSCLTFILAGQEELRNVLADTPELANKLGFHLVVPRLDADETRAYVRHRCKLAGLPVPFQDETYSYLHMKSGGLPALLDWHAENCLIEAYQSAGTSITLDLARNAAAHMNLRDDKGREAQPAPLVFDPMDRLPDGPPPVTPAMRATVVAKDAGSAASPSNPAETGPRERRRGDRRANSEASAPQESASIKLSSLFKSDSGNK